jgi:aerobic carbon-monoxide dehydrogenase large subunit
VIQKLRQQLQLKVTMHSDQNLRPGRLVGQSVERVEDEALLRGQGRFVDDLRIPGTLHCAFVRSPYAHAKVVGIDASTAVTMPGIVAIWTSADLSERLQQPFPSFTPTALLTDPRQWRALAGGEVCFVGQAVAVVIAESRYLAEDAVEQVIVDYEELPVVADFLKALDADAPLAHSDIRSNLLVEMPFVVGDVDAAFRNAAHIVKRRLHHHRATAHPMECRAVLASRQETDELVVWNAGQAPHLLRRAMAEMLEYDEEKLRVIMPDVGGAFGPKGIGYPEEMVVAYAALRLGRPVKWIEDRREHFLCITQERDQLWDVALAFDSECRIVGLRGKVTHDNGAYVPWGIVVPLISVTSAIGPYVVPAVRIDLNVVYTNKVPTTPVRGAGRPKAVFAMERLLDAAADELGLTRQEIRRRNFVQPEQMPYSTGLVFRDGSPQVYDSGDYPLTQTQALSAADIEGFTARQLSARKQGRYLGIGLANYVEGCGLGPYEGAQVRVQNNGRIALNVGGAGAQGQGMRTIFAQIAADQLGVPMEQVDVVVGDTRGLQMGIGTFASRITVNAGNAVHIACGQVAERLRALAGALLQVPKEEVELADGTARQRGNPSRSKPIGAIAQTSYGVAGFTLPAWLEPGMSATHYFTPQGAVYSNGCAVAEVEVDIGTGHVQVLRYAVAHDCGNLINPRLVEGQVLGGILHGVGNTLLECHRYDAQAQPLTTNFAEFALPLATDMPPTLRIVHLESPSPTNPLGVKGAGEGGTIPASAAIVAAIEDALSLWKVRFDQTPVLPETIVKALDAAGAYEATTQ